MLNNNEAQSSGEKLSFKSPTLSSYQWSFDMFRISLTVLSYLPQIDLNATETPLAEKIYSFESQTPTSY
jgi:hypothetical protein